MARVTTQDVINVAYSINADIDQSTADYIAENYDRNRLDYPFDNWNEAVEQMIYQTKEQ
jgi:hypothetical protein